MPPGGPPMMGAQTGPKMMFVSLLPEKAPDKTAWSSRDVELLTKKWRRVRTDAWVSGGRDTQHCVVISYLLRYYMCNRVCSLLIPLSFFLFHTTTLLPRIIQMLLTGGVTADVYNLDDQVLVSIERHLLADTKEFLFEQSEVDFLTLDQQKIYPTGRHK